jgi:hypothetical protein
MNTEMDSRVAAVLRMGFSRAAQTALLALFPLGAAMAQVAPFEEATVLSTDSQPVERSFEIPQSGGGQHRITLTDLGAQLTVPGPAPLDDVNVLITRGRTVVAKLSGDADPNSPVDNLVFDATPGSYQLHIVGKAGANVGSGPVSVQIANVATSAQVVSLSATIGPPETVRPGVRSYQTEIDVPADGAYEMVLANLAFPRPNTLQTAGVFIFPPGGQALTACLSLPAVPTCPTTQTVNLTAGRYVLVAAGALVDPPDAGVFAVHIRASGTGTVLHSRTVELGRIKRVSGGPVQLNTGNHTLSLKDLGFPAALGQVSAIVTRAAQVSALANIATPESVFNVAADGTPYDVFAYATADGTAGAGSYSIEIRPPSGPSVLSSVEAVGSPSGVPSAFAFPAEIAAAGNYRAQFGDFQFPAALSGSRLAIVQNGVVVGKSDPATTTTFSLDVALAAGRATAVVVTRPAVTGGSLSDSGGTFGVELAAVGATQTLLLDATQGVGGVVNIRKVSVAQAGRYDLTVSDLDFPETFRDLMVVVSRGAQRLGRLVVGSGGVSPSGGSAVLSDFEATAGNYSITVLAVPTATVNAAAYGMSFVASPAPPTVTLTATPAAITSGSTAALSWTSQGATSCTASSTPTGVWSGNKATSGTDSSGPVTAATTFTLRCQDAAGRATEKTASVSIAAANNDGGGGGGGGGALGGWFVAMLLAAGAARSAQRLRGRAAMRWPLSGEARS